MVTVVWATERVSWVAFASVGSSWKSRSVKSSKLSQPPGLALPWSLPATNSTALTPGTSHSFGKARSAVSFSHMPISSGMPLISTLLSYPLSLPLPPTNTFRCASPPLPRVSTVRVVGRAVDGEVKFGVPAGRAGAVAQRQRGSGRLRLRHGRAAGGDDVRGAGRHRARRAQGEARRLPGEGEVVVVGAGRAVQGAVVVAGPDLDDVVTEVQEPGRERQPDVLGAGGAVVAAEIDPVAVDQRVVLVAGLDGVAGLDPEAEGGGAGGQRLGVLGGLVVDGQRLDVVLAAGGQRGDDQVACHGCGHRHRG